MGGIDKEDVMSLADQLYEFGGWKSIRRAMEDGVELIGFEITRFRVRKDPTDVYIGFSLDENYAGQQIGTGGLFLEQLYRDVKTLCEREGYEIIAVSDTSYTIKSTGEKEDLDVDQEKINTVEDPKGCFHVKDLPSDMHVDDVQKLLCFMAQYGYLYDRGVLSSLPDHLSDLFEAGPPYGRG